MADDETWDLPSAINDEPARRDAVVISNPDVQGAIIAAAFDSTNPGSHHGAPLSNAIETSQALHQDNSAATNTVVPHIDRRNAIVPTEQTLFADRTGRVESVRESPRANDTMVTPVDATLTRDALPDDASPRTLAPSDDRRILSMVPLPSSREQAAQHEITFTNLQSPGDVNVADGDGIGDPTTYVTKSSTQSPRRNSLGRLLSPIQSTNSRIHPISVYAATLKLRGDGLNPGLPEQQSNDALGTEHQSSTTVLSTQTVQIAEMKPATHLKAIIHTHRTIYNMTQASLAKHFETETESRSKRLVLRFIFVCIFINVSALAFETCDGQNRRSSAPGYPYLPRESVYKAIDAFFSIVFSLEFIGRTIARHRKRDALSDPLTWIDAMSLGPWYLQLILTLAGQDFNIDASTGFAHKLGLLRILRVFRLGYILRHYESMKILVASLKASVPPLMVTMFFLFTLVMLLATAIFYADPCYNFYTCPFTDIFNSAYFIMVTVATVGYGNQVPSTNNVAAMGISFIAMVFGQLYLAMPLTIVGNNFQDAYDNFQQNNRRKLKRNDTTLTPFDSVKLDRKTQRLCDIQYHLLESWRVVQLNIDKLLKKGNELGEAGGSGTKDSTRNLLAGQVQRVEALVEAQIVRLSKIKEAIVKLSDVHTEASTLLQTFIPHKRKPHAEVLAVASGGETALSQVLEKARKAMANRFGSRERKPDPPVLAHSRRAQLWLALEVPDSSRVATAINRVMMGFALLSVWIFCCESLPELANSGVETPACQRVVKAYCRSKGFDLPDSGCFVRTLNNTVDWEAPVEFSCGHPTDDPSCYGHGLNFGSIAAGALPCVDAFDSSGADVICFRMQCIASASAIVNMEPYWIYFEWLFGLSFLSEMLLRFYACHDRRSFFSDVYNIFDILAVLPFAAELCDYMFVSVKPTYAIEATAPSFFSAIRVLKTMRILKLTRHFRGTKVLAQTAKDTWRQLHIPIFFLLTLCILAAAVYFEVERGTECFVGEPCIWWGKNLMSPELVHGLPIGKRILIQDKKLTIITDMLRSTWLSAATFTSVGYGDVHPRTAMGRMFTIFVAVIGTMYTSMPITLVGGKFRALYARHAEKIIIRRGGSSISWKTKRNLLNRTVREDSLNEYKDSNPPLLLFKLEEWDIEQLRQFQSLKRVLQNVQRQIDNLQEVNRDILRTIHPKRASVAAGGGTTVSVSLNVFRRSAAMEQTLQEKCNGILDSILDISSLVEKLQDAPPYFESFLPESTASLHRGSGVESLLPPEVKNRLVHENPRESRLDSPGSKQPTEI